MISGHVSMLCARRKGALPFVCVCKGSLECVWSGESARESGRSGATDRHDDDDDDDVLSLDGVLLFCRKTTSRSRQLEFTCASAAATLFRLDPSTCELVHLCRRRGRR